ncbi:DUF58 domain-containing protein [Marinobacterium jannaschii]
MAETIIPRGLTKRYQDWLSHRRGKGTSLELNQRRIFIFPSAAGLAFIGVAILLFLLGTNYQNNLVMALGFLLTSVFVVTILHTYFNLSGLKVSAVRSNPCFVGEEAGFELRLDACRGRSHENIRLSWPQGGTALVSLKGQSYQFCTLNYPAQQRGVLRPGPLRIESRFPLGILVAWSWLGIDQGTVVYPQPLACGALPDSADSEGDGQAGMRQGNDDFAGLQPYQPGMSPRRIDWKTYARGQGLQAKQYVANQSTHVWLDFSLWPGTDLETLLSRLTYWALRLNQEQTPFGLKLPQCRIAPSLGQNHLDAVLRALAVCGVGTDEA